MLIVKHKKLGAWMEETGLNHYLLGLLEGGRVVPGGHRPHILVRGEVVGRGHVGSTWGHEG